MKKRYIIISILVLAAVFSTSKIQSAKALGTFAHTNVYSRCEDDSGKAISCKNIKYGFTETNGPVGNCKTANKDSVVLGALPCVGENNPTIAKTYEQDIPNSRNKKVSILQVGRIDTWGNTTNGWEVNSALNVVTAPGMDLSFTVNDIINDSYINKGIIDGSFKASVPNSEEFDTQTAESLSNYRISELSINESGFDISTKKFSYNVSITNMSTPGGFYGLGMVGVAGGANGQLDPYESNDDGHTDKTRAYHYLVPYKIEFEYDPCQGAGSQDYANANPGVCCDTYAETCPVAVEPTPTKACPSNTNLNKTFYSMSYYTEGSSKEYNYTVTIPSSIMNQYITTDFAWSYFNSMDTTDFSKWVEMKLALKEPPLIYNGGQSYIEPALSPDTYKNSALKSDNFTYTIGTPTKSNGGNYTIPISIVINNTNGVTPYDGKYFVPVKFSSCGDVAGDVVKDETTPCSGGLSTIETAYTAPFIRLNPNDNSVVGTNPVKFCHPNTEMGLCTMGGIDTGLTLEFTSNNNYDLQKGYYGFKYFSGFEDYEAYFQQKENNLINNPGSTTAFEYTDTIKSTFPDYSLDKDNFSFKVDDISKRKSGTKWIYSIKLVSSVKNIKGSASLYQDNTNVYFTPMKVQFCKLDTRTGGGGGSRENCSNKEYFDEHTISCCSAPNFDTLSATDKAKCKITVDPTLKCSEVDKKETYNSPSSGFTEDNGTSNLKFYTKDTVEFSEIKDVRYIQMGMGFEYPLNVKNTTSIYADIDTDLGTRTSSSAQSTATSIRDRISTKISELNNVIDGGYVDQRIKFSLNPDGKYMNIKEFNTKNKFAPSTISVTFDYKDSNNVCQSYSCGTALNPDTCYEYQDGTNCNASNVGKGKPEQISYNIYNIFSPVNIVNNYKAVLPPVWINKNNRQVTYDDKSSDPNYEYGGNKYYSDVKDLTQTVKFDVTLSNGGASKSINTSADKLTCQYYGINCLEDNTCAKPEEPTTCYGDGKCEGKGYFFRPISLTKPFPNRVSGFNWSGTNTTQYITNSGDNVYANPPLYQIKLTSQLIKEIKEYNKSENYTEWKMNNNFYSLNGATPTTTANKGESTSKFLEENFIKTKIKYSSTLERDRRYGNLRKVVNK